MADKHPYVSANGSLVQVLDHLKKSFPATVDADVLKKLGFAPKNESYVINTLRFLKLIDENSARTEEAQKVFTLHDSSAFSEAFADRVSEAYGGLFQLHGDAAWNLANAQLITYFRQADQSSELVGTRQAGTFRTLAVYTGKAAPANTQTGAKPKPSSNGKPKPKPSLKIASPETQTANTPGNPPPNPGMSDRGVGLTVRIEINLPATGDQDTYDKIFKSIRENLLNA